MSRGVILFAFNSKKYNYYKMAEHTAKRANHFLGLPVTLVTDEESFPEHTDYVWDKVYYSDPSGEIIKKNLNELMEDEAHLSRYFKERNFKIK